MDLEIDFRTYFAKALEVFCLAFNTHSRLWREFGAAARICIVKHSKEAFKQAATASA